MVSMVICTDSDYKLVLPSPNILRLNISKTSDCVSINITDDNIVEGTEMFMVQFNETDDNMIMIGGIDTVYVFIMDNEGMLINSTCIIHLNMVIFEYFVVFSCRA